MSFTDIYNIAGSALNAQTIRLNSIASNMANAGVAAGSEQEAYKALKPVFSTLYTQFEPGQHNLDGTIPTAEVKIVDLVQSNAAVERRYQPQHPIADKEGYVYYSNVNTVEEMADMMSASRSFESNVEVMNRARSMQQGLLRLGGQG